MKADPASRVAVDGALAAVDRLFRLAIVACIGGMVLIVGSQVFARYVLNSSFGWADELSRLLFVWSIFLAIPIGIRKGSHIGVELLTARLPSPLRRLLLRVVMASAAALMLVVAYQSAVITILQWDELMVSLDISAGLFVLALVVGCLHAALHLTRIAAFGAYEVDP